MFLSYHISPCANVSCPKKKGENFRHLRLGGHLLREFTGGHCGLAAEGLCVMPRSIKVLRATCPPRAPHDNMIVDALTKQHGNSGTVLKSLKTRAV